MTTALEPAPASALKPLTTTAALKALTIEARAALHSAQRELTEFPFTVGREMRNPNAGWKKGPPSDRREGQQAGPCQLYLWDPGPEHHVSRQHFRIEVEGDDYVLVDCESALGTWVEGTLIGGHRRGGKVVLEDGDVIVPGGPSSRFIFKFVRPAETD
jgi:hypothetical protein